MAQVVIEVSEEEHGRLRGEAEYWGCETPDGFVQALARGLLREWSIASEAVREEWNDVLRLWIGPSTFRSR